MFEFTVIFFFIIHNVHAYYRVDLGGNWTLTDDWSGIKTFGRVPGSIYTALVDNGIIQNPLYRQNDVNLAWIGYTDWNYTFSFSINRDKVLSKVLVCEGLDTMAVININGKKIGQTDNMFVKYSWDVTDIVQPGVNTISILFTSAVKEAAERANKSAYLIPPQCPPSVENGECHVNQIRKEQCSFGWDWGPSFPTQGIWKPIYLENFNTAIISDLSAVVSKENSQWLISVAVYFTMTGNSTIKGQLFADLSSLNVSYNQQVFISAVNRIAKFVLAIPVSTSVHLWWPKGYGQQPLFNLSVTLTTDSDKSVKQIRLGFRTVELVQEPVTNNTDLGLTFYFRVNGIPIFLKGSNWIPADSFQERVTFDNLKYLLTSAVLANINSLRVWGGGVYESNDFYNLCDELGILIWQDFMFSVAMYPTREEFLESVTMEVKHQVQRLKHHPSIILWAGNNENEKGLRQNWFDTDKNFSLYYHDYLQLYVNTIKPIVNEEDWSREYLTSSPTNGKESEKEGYVAFDPDSEFYGDIHFYNYMIDQWDARWFEVPRMASEYGIQAWCNNETLAEVFIPSDYDMNSKMVSHRQHHVGGNLEMAAEVGLHLNLPDSTNPAVKFTDFIYLTQINQAMSIRSQTEHYRRHQSELLSDGRGLTMGALYWQLNDIWQAPTWASIDYSGSWKMLHYFAKSFFMKNLISPYYVDDKILDVYIVIDEIAIQEVKNGVNGSLSFAPLTHPKDFRSYLTSDILSLMKKSSLAVQGSLKIDMHVYTSFEPIHSWTVSYNLTTTSASVFRKSIDDLLSESGCPAKEKCILYLSSTDSSGVPVSSTWFALTYPKYSTLPPAEVQIQSVVKVDANTFQIELYSNAVALYVWLSLDEIKGHFSDNGFPMLTSAIVVMFYSTADVTADRLASELKVKSLVDVQTLSKNYNGYNTYGCHKLFLFFSFLFQNILETLIFFLKVVFHVQTCYKLIYIFLYFMLICISFIICRILVLFLKKKPCNRHMNISRVPPTNHNLHVLAQV
ncbi:beta-mannosidase-like isoform X1 [Biomphalaria glabrata]|uniref:Beta-mannosidase n=1 Tax=Biomphalaria glabrata TaxID=6526 RepID=A0A9W2YDF5_BIOGL|nr:beta-mannosidase-like isoform X1 [Biomphalaria glabrata]XP_055860763.1 beta-mannosidase-like isoform X1 [Biomphalaria glabrata]